VADDLQEFFPGIQERQARDLISGYGKSTQPSKEEARVALRDLSAQMQKLTQLEALLKKEPLLKSGPQRQEPSARLRELQKQVEQLKKDTGYTGRSREDELKSIRDRIQKTLENQIEELQRVLAGQGTSTAPRQRQVYDANLQALQTLRNSLKVLVAELPQHRLASELRRNTAAEAAAKASETEYNRRIKAKEWKAQGKIQGPQTQAVTEARAAAAAARQQFLDLKRAAQPNFDPNAKELAAFKKRIQAQIDKLNERIAKGEFDPVKRTPRQIKHDADSAKLLTELNKAKRAFIDAKVAAKLAKMGWVDKGIEKLRTLLITARSLMTGGEFSGIGRQGLLTALSRPALFAGNLRQMTEAFKSEQNETAIFDKLWKRPNAINGLYKRAKLALHNPDDYSDLMAEGAARSKLANTIPWFSHTGRAYSTLLADMRAELFDMLVAKYEKRTKAPIGDRAAEALAEFVNDSTGSGKLGFGKRELKGSAKDFLGLGIFSPAFVASRARLLVAASLWQGDMQSRLLIAEEYIRITAGMAALIALASALQGDDEEEMELDPRGGGFLKMQFGATSVDLMAGLNSMATFLTRTIKQETKTQKGIQSIRGEDAPYGQNWLDIFVRFARNKLSPGASFAVNRLTGTDPMGRPQTAMQGLVQAITPITFGAAWDAAMEEPLNRSAALVPAAFLGVGTSTKRPEGASFFKDLQRMGERLTGFNP
jgi:HPt (histidine-containing phosphotransfer) domain-containing protein